MRIYYAKHATDGYAPIIASAITDDLVIVEDTKSLGKARRAHFPAGVFLTTYSEFVLTYRDALLIPEMDPSYDSWISIDQDVPDPRAHESPEITHQRSMLETHRRNVSHYMRQAEAHGGLLYAPPITANGLREARAGMRRAADRISALIASGGRHE